VRDLERFLDRCDEAKLTHVVTAQGDIDLTTSDGRLYARIMASMATKESDDKSRRIKRALLDKAERGKWVGSRPPWGYRKVGDTLVQTKHAPLVRQAVLDILDGASLRSVVARFAGVDGAPQSHQALRGLLLSRTLAGLTKSGTPGDWEPIITLQQRAALCDIIENPERTTHRGTQRVHWLSGVLWCGRCGASMRHDARTRKGVDYSRWMCSGCRGVSIVAGPVEEYLEGALIERAPTVGAPTSPEPSPPKGDGVPLGVLQQRLDDLAIDYADGVVTRDEWHRARTRILEQMQPTPDAPPPMPLATKLAWAGWSVAEKRRAAGESLGRVVVRPGSGDVGDRLDIPWVP
jgi:hypothetical protein